MSAKPMETILATLAESARARVAARLKAVPLSALREQAFSLVQADGAAERTPFAFEQALAAPGLSVIGECKRASPSRGLIAPDFPYLAIANDYVEGSVAAISVLTEPTQFLGDDRYLAEIAASVPVPVLRKDFIVHEAMIYEAKCLGAAAILLIVALKSDAELRDDLALAHELGLSALVEAHDEAEIECALKAGARIVGVNNRNLHTFEVDASRAQRLRALVGNDALFVAESGLKTVDDIVVQHSAGADAVLVGEMLMRAPDRVALLKAIRAASATVSSAPSLEGGVR